MRPKTNQQNGGGPNPGPGTYDTAGRGTSGPNYTMRVKPESNFKTEGPGPGAYDDTKEPVAHKNPSWKIGTEKRGNDLYDAHGPGPGHYENKRELNNKGTRFPKDARGKTVGVERAPGPGNYSLESDIDHGVRHNKGKTFAHRTPLSGSNMTPAPGAYEQNVSPVRQSPAKYGFGTSTRTDGVRNLNPPPNAYESKDSYVKQSAPKWGLGSGPQRGTDVSSAKHNPGPGTYTPGLKGDSTLKIIQNRSTHLASKRRMIGVTSHQDQALMILATSMHESDMPQPRSELQKEAILDFPHLPQDLAITLMDSSPNWSRREPLLEENIEGKAWAMTKHQDQETIT